MTRSEFERHIGEAIMAMPARVRDGLVNVAFVVEEGDPVSAGERDDDIEDDECDLLGLYEGVPRSHFSGDPSGLLPDKITLFMRSILAEAGETGVDPAEVIRHTVWHEVAHYFGFEEEDARRLERKWETRFAESKKDAEGE
jgi:predicted Zn-dependent protease with MMP-like domain